MGVTQDHYNLPPSTRPSATAARCTHQWPSCSSAEHLQQLLQVKVQVGDEMIKKQGFEAMLLPNTAGGSWH